MLQCGYLNISRTSGKRCVAKKSIHKFSHPSHKFRLGLVFHLLLHRLRVQPEVFLHLLVIEHNLRVNEALRPEVEEVFRLNSLLSHLESLATKYRTEVLKQCETVKL